MIRYALAALTTFGLLATLALPAFGQPASRSSEQDINLTAQAELGFLSVLDHDIQFSNSGTRFDYDEQGGQDTLFPVSRFSLDLDLGERHTVVFLYQPLELRSRELLAEDLVVDDLTFPSGTTVDFTYGFPFYRVSYLYDLIADPRHELSVGASLQLRNATIIFESTDGELFRTNRDVGPVPILKARGRYAFGRQLWAGFEADGFYAPISYINGSDNEVVGAILDASVRLGVDLPRNTSAFVNLRYIGGGALGTSEAEGPGDGYVENWLHFMTVTVGGTLSIL